MTTKKAHMVVPNGIRKHVPDTVLSRKSKLQTMDVILKTALKCSKYVNMSICQFKKAHKDIKHFNRARIMTDVVFVFIFSLLLVSNFSTMNKYHLYNNNSFLSLKK